MFSRAHLLIEKEYEKLKSDLPWGIEASPLTDDNIFEWAAEIRGLKDSVWDGAFFIVYIKFDEHYNIRPPEICFHTVPYHPNIDMVTGRPCIDYLDLLDKWDPSNSLSVILVTLQYLLSNPVLENPVNIEAAEMYRHLPNVYKQTVQKCVEASQAFKGTSASSPSDIKKKIALHPEKGETSEKETYHSQMEPARITKLSFDDYYTTWSGIATSKPMKQSKNPLLEQIRKVPYLVRVHMGLKQAELDKQIIQHIEESRVLAYGLVNSHVSEEKEKAAKMEKLQRMRQIYIRQRMSPSPLPQNIELEKQLHGINTGKDEIWEKEVDDLVAWTNNLDPRQLDI